MVKHVLWLILNPKKLLSQTCFFFFFFHGSFLCAMCMFSLYLLRFLESTLAPSDSKKALGAAVSTDNYLSFCVCLVMESRPVQHVAIFWPCESQDRPQPSFDLKSDNQIYLCSSIKKCAHKSDWMTNHYRYHVMSSFIFAAVQHPDCEKIQVLTELNYQTDIIYIYVNAEFFWQV